MRFINEIRQTADGAAVLSEWLGQGGLPVEKALAETRSSICEGCPENKAPGWWDKNKGRIAETIKRHLGIKHQMALKVSNESKVHMCSQCGCCISLKVWVPMAHIMHHTSPELLSKFPGHCWIKNEILNS